MVKRETFGKLATYMWAGCAPDLDEAHDHKGLELSKYSGIFVQNRVSFYCEMKSDFHAGIGLLDDSNGHLNKIKYNHTMSCKCPMLKGTYRDHRVTSALNFHKIQDFCIFVMVLDV